jgi:ubiquinone biosynthesis protein
MVGRLSEERRDQLVHLLLGLVQQEPALVANVLLDWAGDSIVNEEALTAELQAFVDQHLGTPLKQLRLGTMLADLVGILRSHQLYLPPDLALFIKAFVSLEGMGRDLDPDLDLAGEAVPMLREALLTRYAPAALAKRGWHAASEISKLMSDLPRDISQLLRSARRGRLEIHIDVGHLKHVGDQLDLATNRLIIGIIVASIIVGSSVVMTVSGGPTLFGLPFFGLLGFVFATIGGVLLTVSISRSNKADRERKS